MREKVRCAWLGIDFVPMVEEQFGISATLNVVIYNSVEPQNEVVIRSEDI